MKYPGSLSMKIRAKKGISTPEQPQKNDPHTWSHCMTEHRLMDYPVFHEQAFYGNSSCYGNYLFMLFMAAMSNVPHKVSIYDSIVPIYPVTMIGAAMNCANSFDRHLQKQRPHNLNTIG
ncbi:hypothetical protein [Candidatus Sororendozoicomonas aggregata]|uniref:hypothetical protein n=1 Tax=Candidatus Sororendozoicomonas aggregata TaxID=3073239 RepID=UPI002ED0A81F